MPYVLLIAILYFLYPLRVTGADVSDVVEDVTMETGKSRADVDVIVESFLNAVRQRLANGEQVGLKDFGTFTVVDYPARVGRNPKTGDTINVPARKKIVFKPSRTLSNSQN